MYVQDKYALNCNESSFECSQNVDGKKEKLQFESTDARNGVFFMTVKQTFKTEAGVSKEYSGVGMFGTFLLFQRRLSSNRRSFYAYVHIDEVRQA